MCFKWYWTVIECKIKRLDCSDFAVGHSLHSGTTRNPSYTYKMLHSLFEATSYTVHSILCRAIK